METVSLILQVVTLLILGWIITKYFPSYMQKKGENRATLEDTAGITSKTEGARYVYVSDLERLKSDLQKNIENLKSDLQKSSEAETKKREVYHEMVKSMGVFISGRKSDELKDSFLSNYSTMWLWAPDRVLKAIDELIDLNTLSQHPHGLDEEKIKNAYANCVLEMRKDAAHPDTKLDHNDHRYVSFSNS